MSLGCKQMCPQQFLHKINMNLDINSKYTKFGQENQTLESKPHRKGSIKSRELALNQEEERMKMMAAQELPLLLQAQLQEPPWLPPSKRSLPKVEELGLGMGSYRETPNPNSNPNHTIQNQMNLSPRIKWIQPASKTKSNKSIKIHNQTGLKSI